MMFDPALLDLAAGAFITLFVVVDPIGLAPIFIALTAGMNPSQRRRVGMGAVAIGAVVLALFGAVGQEFLRVVGIGLPAFRISGGLMLFLIALEMLFERRTERRAKSAGADLQDPAARPEAEVEPANDPTVFPLATPLIAGPGAMASMILLTSRAETAAQAATIYLCLAAVLAVCLALFLAAGLVERALGPTGIKLVTRLLGVLLGALAVQFVLDGFADLGAFGPS